MTPTWSSAVVVLSVAASLVSPRRVGGEVEGVARARLARGLPSLSAELGLPASFQQPLPPVSERLAGPATTFANLSPQKCRQLLGQSEHKGSFERLGPRNGIATPLRWIAPLGDIQVLVPPKKSMYGNLDCRQALLWIELMPVLVEHGVVRIQIDNFYRNHARIRRGRKSQHAYGLAADITAIEFDADEGTKMAKTGARLPSGHGRVDVEDDFLGRLGAPVCGPEAKIVPRADSDPEQVARAIRLRNLLCDLARRGAFHHILTPNYDAAHKNHLHLDLKRDNKWFSIE